MRFILIVKKTTRDKIHITQTLFGKGQEKDEQNRVAATIQGLANDRLGATPIDGSSMSYTKWEKTEIIQKPYFEILGKI